MSEGGLDKRQLDNCAPRKFTRIRFVNNFIRAEYRHNFVYYLLLLKIYGTKFM